MRLQARFQISAACRFWWSGSSGESSFASGWTRNLSSGGVAVVAPVLPPVGSVVMLEVDLPRLGEGGKSLMSPLLLTVEGTVLRHHSSGEGFVAMTTYATFANTALAFQGEGIGVS